MIQQQEAAGGGVPSITYLDISEGNNPSLSEHVDHKYLSDVYCTHLNMKNKFLCNYDDTNLH